MPSCAAVLRRAPELRRQPQQEVGECVPRPCGGRSREREVAVWTVHEVDDHVFLAHVEPELRRVPSEHPGHVVGELRHFVQPADERLLCIADAEEPGEGDVGEPRRDRDVLRHVDPVVAVRQPARGLRRGPDSVVREPRHIDRPRREDVGVRGHHVLECRLRDGSDRAGRWRRDRVGLAAQVPHEQRVVSRQVVVPPQPHLVTVVGRVGGGDVPCARCVIGAGNEVVQQPPGARADPIRRNGVVRERRSGDRIADRRRSKVAGSLSVRRDDEIQRLAARVAVSLVIPESEHLVPLNRPSEARAELVLLQLRLGLARRREEVPRLERVVAVEFPGRSVDGIAARSGHDVDDGAGVAAVLRAVGMRQDLEFLNRVGRGSQHETCVERVVVARAVEQEVVRLVPHSIDAETGRGRPETAWRRVTGRASDRSGRRDDPWQQRARGW